MCYQFNHIIYQSFINSVMFNVTMTMYDQFININHFEAL